MHLFLFTSVALRNGNLSAHDSVSIAMNLEEANNQMDRLSVRSNVLSTNARALSVSSQRLQSKRASTAPSLAAESKHVTINIDPIEETPDVMIKPGQTDSGPEFPLSDTNKPPAPKAPSSQKGDTEV